MLYALLDDDNILTGFAHEPVQETVRQIPLDQDECDLEPGRYRWDDVARSFVPLRKPDTELDALRATADVIACIVEGGELSDHAIAWASRVLGRELKG